jgi:hypothetical protein
MYCFHCNITVGISIVTGSVRNLIPVSRMTCNIKKLFMQNYTNIKQLYLHLWCIFAQ